jgi:hypothetical protein
MSAPRPTKGVLVPLTDHIALVSLTSDVPTRRLLQAAAAVQKQITRDFTPYWGIRATVDAFESLDDIPSDYRPVVLFGDAEELLGQLEFAIGEQYATALVDDFERNQMSGLHLNAFSRQPFALVAAVDEWSVILSHEVLEMITDPFGNRLVAATHPIDPKQRVTYLLEVCDPCQSMWYAVNGVPVSDFYMPKYFDPVGPERSRYSFTGALEYPLQILDGGYLSWIDPMDSGLYQLIGGESKPRLLASERELAGSTAALRTVVDTNAGTPRPTRETVAPAFTAPGAAGGPDAVREASEGTALRTRQAVLSLARPGVT